MSFNLDTFKGALGVAARPNNFYITMTAPSGVLLPQLAGNAVKSLCKATTIPSYTMGVIEIPHIGGRRMKVPGDRTFTEWSATFIGEESMALHANFEAWTQAIKSSDYGLADLASTTNYYGTIDIYHLNNEGKEIAQYTLKDAFPTELAQVDMSYDNTDAILEYTVTFQYSYLQDSDLTL